MPDAVVPGRTGELVTAGHYDALAAAAVRWLQSDYDSAACVKAGARFAWPRFHAELRAALEPVLDRRSGPGEQAV